MPASDEELSARGVRGLADFLALRRDAALLLAALLLAGIGERLWLGFAPKYLEYLGAGALVIGLFDGLLTLLGAVYAYPGGWLTDRLGHRRSLLIFSALSLGGYALVLAWQHWLALLIGAFLFVSWSALSLPATFAVIATSIARERQTMGVGVQSMIRRIPMIAGPIVGATLIDRFGWQTGVQVALVGCIGLNAATMLVQSFMAEASAATRTNALRHAGPSFVQIVRSFNPTLRELLVSDILIRFCERLPYAFVILWAMDHGRVNVVQFSWLVSIEMFVAMVCYIPVAHLADRYGQRPFVLVTFLFFTAFPVVLAFADGFTALALAFAVRGLKEFGEPARKALIIAQAAPQVRARTYGAYYLIRDCVVTSGSLLGAWLWTISPYANFAAAAAFGFLGTIWFWWFQARFALASRVPT